MTVPSTAELALLNTHPQRTQLYLSIYEPDVALSCQTNGAYSTANQTIGYDNVTEGNYLNIGEYYFQVALIGTTPGAEDIGRTWVRSATNNTLRFVESDHIDWADDLYVTVLKYTEIIPVFPRIIQDPGDETDVIFYKIWDVAYTNQNSILGSFINMGSDFAGFLDGGQCNVYWSASGTTHLLGSNLTYQWSFEGATTTGSTSHTPGNITYDTPGHYRTILIATGANGSVDTSIRYVSIYDRPDAGSNMPIMNFELSEFGGSRDSVGYSCRVRIREAISESKVKDGMLVVVFKEDWYGYTKQSINKNDMGRSGILFVGYINGGTIQYNSEDGYVEFEIISPTNLMEITECFSVSVESKASPATWYELINMSIKRAVHHYYRWHSTVLLCKDFTCQFTDQNIQYFDADRTSLYDACNTLLDGTIKGRMISDSLGHVWAEQDVSAIDNSDGTLNVTLDVNKDVFIETPIIDERHYEEVSFIEMGGIAYDNGTGASSAYLASAPGSAPAYRGKTERKQGLALSSQAQLNTLVGNLYAYLNSDYPNVELRLRGNYANLDIAPQEQIHLTIEANDTPRRITFTDKSFALRSVNWNWDATSQILIPSIGVTEMTQGFAGSTIVIPEIPPDAGDDGGSFKQPPVVIPPLPVVTTPPASGGSGTIAIYNNGEFIMNANAINFIGSIVQVLPYTVSGSLRADVFFDACGCSGTFAEPGLLYGLVDHTGAICKTSWSGTSQQLTNYSEASFDQKTGYFTVATGSATLLSEFTGLYDLDFTFTATLGSAPIGACNINYDITLHVGNHSFNYTGSKTGTINGPNPIVSVPISIYSLYLQEGESMVWYVDYDIDDNANNLDDATFCVGIINGSITAHST